MIKVFYKKCCVDLIHKVSNASSQTHIIMHGYGHTLPTGKGVSFLGFSFSGPWLRPALTSKRILDSSDQTETVSAMINYYNDMLSELDESYPDFHYVDLRPIIDPKNDWTNELHLKNSAYARVADKINEVMKQIS